MNGGVGHRVPWPAMRRRQIAVVCAARAVTQLVLSFSGHCPATAESRTARIQRLGAITGGLASSRSSPACVTRQYHATPEKSRTQIDALVAST